MTVKDQIGNLFSFDAAPKRIISLVPSQTELLFDLGLENEVVGVTKFCIYPKEKTKEKTVIGGTKKLRFEVVHRLQPDLVIANKEENVKEHIEALREDYPVWVSDIKTLEDALQMIEAVGQITQTEKAATDLTAKIQRSFKAALTPKKRKALYLIWRNPYMAAGSDTFINEMMQRAGFENICSQNRYPALSFEEMKALKPEIILLSSEPFPFKAKHVQEIRTELPNTEVMLVDGELFSWYGSRLLKSAAYFLELRGGVSDSFREG